MLVHVAQIVPVTEAEGPGRRFALWFQGCPLRCPGCCNPEMLSFAGGTKTELSDVLDQIAAAERHGIEGISFLGGEPMAHAGAAALLACAAQGRSLSVMVFSGYTLEEIRARPEASVQDLLQRTDILVDGPYCADLPETRRRWIGSSNQRVHFLTDHYRADDPRWLLPNTLEIRLHGLDIQVNGFPTQTAGLWKRRAR